MAVKAKKIRKATKKKPASGLGIDLEYAISSIRLIESKANMRITGGVLPSVMSMRAACEGSAPETTDKGVIHVFYRVNGEVHCTPPPESGSESKIDVFCQYEVNVIATRMPTKAEVEFAAGMAANLAWPYIRVHISRVTSEMGVPPITMPLLKSTPEGLTLFQL